MAQAEMIERSFVAPSGVFWPSAHAASCVALPDGSLIASWFAGSREGAPDVAIWAARYHDAKWSAPWAVIDTPGRSDGNSVLWMDGAGTLRIWYVTMEGRGWATCPVRERCSHDGGLTWDEARYIRREWGWMVRNEPIWFRESLLMPMYDERDWSSFVLVSDDSGETWRESRHLRGGRGIIQPALAEQADGWILMLLRSRAGAVYAARSEDGLTWSTPAATRLANPNSAVELIRLRSGALLAVYNASTSTRTPLRVDSPMTAAPAGARGATLRRDRASSRIRPQSRTTRAFTCCTRGIDARSCTSRSTRRGYAAEGTEHVLRALGRGRGWALPECQPVSGADLVGRDDEECAEQHERNADQGGVHRPAYCTVSEACMPFW
jgi:hypothetical protein